MHEAPELSVVLPVYNGAGFVARSLDELGLFLDRLPLSSEIVVVDDGSTDGAADVVRGVSGPRVRLEILDRNRGKFAALKVGMTAARGRCRVFTDADLPYDLEALPYIHHLVARGGFHVVVGDRTLPGSRYHGAGGTRPLATRVFSAAVRLLVTGELFDTQCGLKGFRGDVADALFPLLTDPGFAGDVEALYVALKHNLAIRRIPVRLRAHGPSTVRLVAHAPRMAFSILGLRRRWTAGRYRSPELARIAAQRYWEPASVMEPGA